MVELFRTQLSLYLEQISWKVPYQVLSSIKNARMRNDITLFKQLDDEPLFEAWERFKELLKRCPHYGIPICIQMEHFYNGVLPAARIMLDASAGGTLLTMSYNEAYAPIESIAANSY